MQFQIPRWRNLSMVKNSLVSSTPIATHFASFHSTPTSFQKWENKWKSVSLLFLFLSISFQKLSLFFFFFFFSVCNGALLVTHLVKVCILYGFEFLLFVSHCIFPACICVLHLKFCIQSGAIAIVILKKKFSFRIKGV